MKVRGILSAACVLAVLAGCAAGGVKVTDSQVQQFQVGKTTEAEVIATLGAPTMRTRMADGSVLVVYHYAESSVRAASFIPIVGMFAGGADVRANAVSLTFGPDGKLKNTTATSSEYGTGHGVSAGAIDTSKVPQPKQ